MASTCLDIIKNALRSVGVISITESPSADMSAAALEIWQNLILSLPCFASNWREIEINENYTAGVNERVTVIGDVNVTVTLPQQVVSERDQVLYVSDLFTIATGTYYSAPRDGSRVMVSAQQGTDRAAYAYRADTGKWISFINLELTSTIPFNADLHRYLQAMLAFELAGAFGLDVPLFVQKLAIEGERECMSRFTVIPDAKIDGGMTRDWGAPR